MVTIFIQEVNHLKTISDLKYKHNPLILTHKKLTIRLSGFCWTATVERMQTNRDRFINLKMHQSIINRKTHDTQSFTHTISLIVVVFKVDISEKVLFLTHLNYWGKNVSSTGQTTAVRNEKV